MNAKPDVYVDIERHAHREPMAARVTMHDPDFPGFIRAEVVLSSGALGDTHYINPKAISNMTKLSFPRAKQLAVFRNVDLRGEFQSSAEQS